MDPVLATLWQRTRVIEPRNQASNRAWIASSPSPRLRAGSVHWIGAGSVHWIGAGSVCGGAHCVEPWAPERRGRSPRVRGSPRQVIGSGMSPGSIPACAGEPAVGRAVRIFGLVDPRVCGGARGSWWRPCSLGGRSPRVRGSRKRSRASPSRTGSIPACAGEPRASAHVGKSSTVDPRVCGGALGEQLFGGAEAGRSPRVRGSRQAQGCGASGYRSIPAYAGEPTQGSRSIPEPAPIQWTPSMSRK
jgi:hypothetical protein